MPKTRERDRERQRESRDEVFSIICLDLSKVRCLHSDVETYLEYPMFVLCVECNEDFNPATLTNPSVTVLVIVVRSIPIFACVLACFAHMNGMDPMTPRGMKTARQQFMGWPPPCQPVRSTCSSEPIQM